MTSIYSNGTESSKEQYELLNSFKNFLHKNENYPRLELLECKCTYEICVHKFRKAETSLQNNHSKFSSKSQFSVYVSDCTIQNEDNSSNRYEFYLALELQKLCSNGKELDYKKSRLIFHKLSHLYRQKSPDMFSLIRSAALLNAALCRSLFPDNDLEQDFVAQIKQDLKELGHHVLCLANSQHKKDLAIVADSLTKSIQTMRDETKQSLKKFKNIPFGLPQSELYNCEFQKIKNIKQIQESLTEDYTHIMANISKTCESIMGEPPCKYTVVGMGSLARKEVTPYSDFEHVIVLENNCDTYDDNYEKVLEYFRWYSVIFHLIVINLQETILPSVAIPCLNDKYSELGNWFFDAHTTRGISFDGMMPHACKFPLGRQQKTTEKDFTVELIQPIDKMLHFLSSKESIKNGYHLSDILTKTCFVYGNKNIYQFFLDGVKSKLNSVSERESLKVELRKSLIRDLEKFSTKRALDQLKSKEFNIKHVIYRTTTLFISAWGRLEGINESSCFDIISSLAEKGHITEFAKHKLMYAVAVACEVRLRFYFENKRQEDTYNRQQSDAFVEIVGEQSLISYLQIADALQLEVRTKFELSSDSFNFNFQTLNIGICNSLGLKHFAWNLLSKTKFPSMYDQKFVSFDECLKHSEKKIQKYLTFTQRDFSKARYSKKKTFDKHKNYKKFAECLSLYETGNFSSASDQLKELLKSSQSNFDSCNASYLELAGLCKFELKDFVQAKMHFDQACIILQEISVEENVEDAIATMNYNIGICFLETHMRNEANLSLEKALSIYCNLLNSKCTFEVLFRIGLCYFALNKYSDSFSYLEYAHDILKKSFRYNFGELAEITYFMLSCLDEKHKLVDFSQILEILLELETQWWRIKIKNVKINTSFTFLKLGNLLLSWKLFKYALKWLMNAERLYRQHCVRNKLFLVEVLKSIGLCFMEMNQYYNSMNYFYDALATYEILFFESDETQEFASIFSAIGHCFLDMSHYSDASYYMQKSILAFSNISLNADYKQTLARLHDSFGISLIETQKFNGADFHLSSSLKIKQELSLDEYYDKDIAITYTILGKCLMKKQLHSEALKVFFKALKIQENSEDIKTNDFGVAMILNSLGLCCMELFNIHEASFYLKKSYEICASLTSQNEIQVKQLSADVVNNIGLIEMNSKQCGYALSRFEIAMNLYEEISPNKDFDRDIAVVLNNFGLCYMNMNLFAEASNYLQKARKIFYNTSENSDADARLADCLNNFGICLTKLKWPESSLSYLYKSLAIYEQISNNTESDKYIAGVLCNIGNAFALQNLYDESLKNLMMALKIQRNVSDNQSTDRDLALILNDVGNCKKQTSDWSEAILYFEQSLKILKKATDDESNDVFVLSLLRNCAECVLEMEKRREMNPENIFWEVAMMCFD